MKELTTNSLDPFDFTLWDCIADTARKKRKSKCNWEPFIKEYKHLYNSSYDRSKVFTGKTLDITIAFYTSNVPVAELVKTYGGSIPSVSKIAESTLLKIITLARKSLLPYPCNNYRVMSEERDGNEFRLVHSYSVYAKSEGEAIELVHKYIPKSKEYTLDVDLLSGEVGNDPGITFV
jgi:hypothetical protein